MFFITWVIDKLGYIPKVTIDTTFPFPAVRKDYVPHELEKKIAKKTTTKKTTTRKKK